MKFLWNIIVYTSILASTIFPSSEARNFALVWNLLGTNSPEKPTEGTMKLGESIHLQNDEQMDEPYGSRSPLYTAPFASLAPLPQHENGPPISCTNPQPSQQSPPQSISHTVPSPPTHVPKPSPPESIAKPPSVGSSPPKRFPGAPAYQPPVAYPPAGHIAPSPPGKQPHNAVWCVAKPAVPDQIMQAALDYACGSGADCKPIAPNGPCYLPNTLLSHASYAFNNYWQKKKSAGGTCDFGGTAMLVTVNPSFSGCEFVYS